MNRTRSKIFNCSAVTVTRPRNSDRFRNAFCTFSAFAWWLVIVKKVYPFSVGPNPANTNKSFVLYSLSSIIYRYRRTTWTKQNLWRSYQRTQGLRKPRQRRLYNLLLKRSPKLLRKMASLFLLASAPSRWQSGRSEKEGTPKLEKQLKSRLARPSSSQLAKI